MSRLDFAGGESRPPRLDYNYFCDLDGDTIISDSSADRSLYSRQTSSRI